MADLRNPGGSWNDLQVHCYLKRGMDVVFLCVRDEILA